MQLNIGQYWKQLAVAALIAVLFAMDLLHVQDEQLRYLVFALIGSITGWHALNNLPGTKQPMPGPAPVTNNVVLSSPPGVMPSIQQPPQGASQ